MEVARQNLGKHGIYPPISVSRDETLNPTCSPIPNATELGKVRKEQIAYSMICKEEPAAADGAGASEQEASRLQACAACSYLW